MFFKPQRNVVHHIYLIKLILTERWEWERLRHTEKEMWGAGGGGGGGLGFKNNNYVFFFRLCCVHVRVGAFVCVCVCVLKPFNVAYQLKGKGNQMTTLRFQTRWRHQTSPASLQGNL